MNGGTCAQPEHNYILALHCTHTYTQTYGQTLHTTSPTYLPIESCCILPHLFTDRHVDVSRLGSTTRDPETDKEKQTHKQLQMDTKVCGGGGGRGGWVCLCWHVGGWI